LFEGEFAVKNNYYLAEEQLLRKAIGILMERLGPVETRRFLSLPNAKKMESVKRHRDWQATLDKDEFFDLVFKNQ
jgi:hypothetical protein